MDIVSNLPFTLQFNNSIVPNFSTNERDIYKDDFPSCELEENTMLSVLFDSSDTDARLYFDALDIISGEINIGVDEKGIRYKKTSNVIEDIINVSSIESLRVDAYPILVICNNIKYYSMIYVVPKQMELNEWRMMRDDLESEIRGLAQDYLKKNMGFYTHITPELTQEALYKFYVIKKYAKALTTAFMAISEAPKYQIITEYECRNEAEVTKIDDYTIRKLLNSTGKQTIYHVPVKHINYDIQENRLLKNIIHMYSIELSEFISIIEKTLSVSDSEFRHNNIKISRISRAEMQNMLEEAKRLRQITNVIKNKTWYKTISNLTSGHVPHSFILDSRYSVLYKMYQELRHLKFEVVLDSHYFYCWKKSSTLYEMWCYIKLCRAFTNRFILQNNIWSQNSSNDFVFPFLFENTKMVFRDSEGILEFVVTFNQELPTKAQNTSLKNHPCYTVGTHTKPDITIDIYAIEENWYIGTVILECKYRKLSSFWLSHTASSKSQIQSYYTEVQSAHLLGKMGEILRSKPVGKIVVLTPDYAGEDVEAKPIKTVIKTLRPADKDEMVDNVVDVIFDGVEEMVELYKYVSRISKLENN